MRYENVLHAVMELAVGNTTLQYGRARHDYVTSRPRRIQLAM